MLSLLKFFCLVWFLLCGLASAQSAPAPFDLAGPTLKVQVTRAGKTLPISAVPNLAAGDQLAIKADLPAGQSAHYLLVAAFLRGATNPPPESWFYSAETWTRKGALGLAITVPAEAQQVLIFLAPATGGDFKTLISAVRGRPGAFVRASQDLNQASLDRARLKAYLAAVQRISLSDYDRLKTVSPLLARSLLIKLDPECLQKLPALQAPCLTQGRDALILNDGHSTSIVQALTTGAAGDLLQQMAISPVAGFGYYSPYIASVVDIARILDSFHTAQYQYIPALATGEEDRLTLALNAPPSFHNPKSVLVVALPAVEPPQMPPLHSVDAKQVYCAERSELVLPVEGAPLVYATGYAHQMVLRLKGKDGNSVDLPVVADAEKGGFVAHTEGISPANFGDRLDGSLHGDWGFEAYDGPEFHLENSRPQHWQLDDEDRQSLIAGRDNLVRIESQSAACVDSILLETPSGESVKAEWKSTGPKQLAVALPLKKVKPGALKLLVKQFGAKEPEIVPLQAFAEAGHLDSFTLHSGDRTGILKGSQLDQVKELTLNGIGFKPVEQLIDEDAEEISMAAEDANAAALLHEGDDATAKVALEDGRLLPLDLTIAAPRPRVTLIGKSIQPAADAAAYPVQLDGADELPENALLTFSLHALTPAALTGEEKIEVATLHGAFLATLNSANGLILEDSQVALATLDTAKAFAASAAGPLRFRVVVNGLAGDWQPLATLVRLPAFTALQCPSQTGPATADRSCKLTGSRLFLVDALSADPRFDQSTPVPVGFPGSLLSVPHPNDGVLYLKLHDDPGVVNSVHFSTAVEPRPIAASPTAPAAQSAPPSTAVPVAPPATTAPPPAAASLPEVATPGVAK
jgi:hypothetical protein